MTWKNVSLADLALSTGGSFVDGPFGSNLKSSEYEIDGVPIIRLQNVRPNEFLSKDIKFISQRKADELARHGYSPGDLVISKLGDPPGYACVVPDSAGSGVIVADVVRFRGDPALVNHYYLSFYLNSPVGRQQFLKLSKGTTRTRVNLSSIKTIEIPLPPTLDEQKRIAAVLDKAYTLCRQRQESLQINRDFLQSVFIDMFGDPVRNPKGWPLANFGQEMGRISYGTSVKCSKVAEDGSRTVLRIPNVASGEINWTDLKFATFPEAEWSSLKLMAGDILFVRTNGNPSLVAKTAVFDGSRDAAFASYLIRVRLKDRSKLKPEFINSVLSMPSWRAKLLKLARTTAGNYNINTQAIKGLELIAPDLDMQDRFCRAITDNRAFAETLQESLFQSELLFSSIQQRAFRGELNLSRLVLEEEVKATEKPVAENLHQSAAVALPMGLGTKSAKRAFVEPSEIEPVLNAQDASVENGDPIPWSEDYFRYRILGRVLEAPYCFSKIWEAVEQRMPEANYNDVKEKVFAYIADGTLRQRFDKTQKALVFFPRRA